MDEIVVFEKSSAWEGRYMVQAKGEGVSWINPYQWVNDRKYETEPSAIFRAENLLHKRGIYEVRVIDLGEPK